MRLEDQTILSPENGKKLVLIVEDINLAHRDVSSGDQSAVELLRELFT